MPKSNPLKTHFIGAQGCDGTIKGFISSKQTYFKYCDSRHVDQEEFAKAYKSIAQIAINDDRDKIKEALQFLEGFLDDVHYKLTKAASATEEGEKCMETLSFVVEKVTNQVDELIAEETKPIKK